LMMMMKGDAGFWPWGMRVAAAGAAGLELMMEMVMKTHRDLIQRRGRPGSSPRVEGAYLTAE
jgi:hypothetical protein